MLIKQNTNETITIESIEESLLASEQIISKKWLAHEETKESSDPILLDTVSIRTDKQISQMIREGKHQVMHPIAEAILVGKKIRQFHQQNGVILGSHSLGRLLSIRDIVRRRNSIDGFNSRIPRLLGTQWQSALYELLTATAYSDFAKTVLIKEDDSKKPDIRVDCAVPFYAECKAKLQYEDAVSRFKWRVRKEALGVIFTETKKCRTGLMIQMEIHDDACISKLPNVIKDMIASGALKKNISGASIKATPSASGLQTLPRPMSSFSSDMWDFLFGFKEWMDCTPRTGQNMLE